MPKPRAIDKIRGIKRGRDRELEDERREEESDSAPPSLEVPFVEIGENKYWSNRFYLHRTVYDPPKASAPSHQSRVFTLYNQDCNCGARQAPPLLDLEKLVASLDLKAAILSTYVISLPWIAKAYPALCGPEATVPTLILHGHKGLAKRLESQQKKAAAGADDSDSDSECSLDFDMVPEGNLAVDSENNTKEEPVGPTVHLSQVFPRYLAPKDFPAWRKKDGWQKKLKTKQGVHHPKYMILFEKSGSVIVLVSTGNLTRPKSTDASWLQRFEPAAKPSATAQNAKPVDNNKLKPTMRRDGSDFGLVLANFLQCQSYAAGDGDMLPQEFLQKYMDFKCLDEFATSYQFEKAEVHLIATVPGEHQDRFTIKHLRSDGNEVKEFLYGRQRVADIISRLSKDTKEACARFRSKLRWFPEALMSKNDRLILQPTSLGAHYSRPALSDVVRSYLGHDDKQKEQGKELASAKRPKPQKSWLYESYNDQELLDRLDIVWPSQKFFDAVNKHRSARRKSSSPRSVAGLEDNMVVQASSPGQKESPPTAPQSSFVFLSCRVFNTTDLACLSQMVMFEPSVPEQREPLLPHFKSVSRIFNGDEGSLRNEYGIGKAESYFPYFLLTSACLSHGAQGRTVEGAGREGTLSYANFELGVMFTSRLQKKASDRMYCWKPAHCKCPYPPESSSEGERPNANLIHLPIPYCCHATSFQPEGETSFREDPYFHEIMDSSTGNMRLLPMASSLKSTSRA